MAKGARGGARKGAGRPKAEHPATVTIRVPWEHRERLPEIIETWELIQIWKTEAEKHPTSPRWQKLRELMDSLP